MRWEERYSFFRLSVDPALPLSVSPPPPSILTTMDSPEDACSFFLSSPFLLSPSARDVGEAEEEEEEEEEEP